MKKASATRKPVPKKKSSKAARRSAWPKNLPDTGEGPHPPKGLKKGQDFFVVCIGASAGGLDPVKEILRLLPAKTGMAFVFIQHLSPTHESLLPEILSRFTGMRVRQVTEGMKLLPEHLYVISPGTTMFLQKGSFTLTSRAASEKPHHPIDRFMESMAYELGSRAIGVVLSGTGSDGSEGTRLIKAEGGITFAQSPKSAAYDSMPIKAIIADDIDFILDPKAIAKEISGLSRMHQSHQVEQVESRVHEVPKAEQSDFIKIMQMLKQSVGTDFAQYKPTTIRRRIARRMLLLRLKTLTEYSQYILKNPDELTALSNDVLINVTSFFRDPESFDYLKNHVLPTLLKNRPPSLPLRIWSAGCSTGEETYSLAMIVIEALGPEANLQNVQIFATDLSHKCISKARMGHYLATISEHVSDERLARFFTKTEIGYRISKQVRDLCIFARHDLTRDPAYSKLDLITCRNLLIYLGQDLQTRALENFHYSLNPNGFLCLGKSESVGKSADLFSTVETGLKIYSKKSVASRVHGPNVPRRDLIVPEESQPRTSARIPPAPGLYDLHVETDRAILSRFTPACVVVNARDEILQFRGNTEQYLSHKHGEATLGILRMAREGLGAELKKALAKSRQQDTAVRIENLLLTGAGLTTLEVVPLKFLPGERCHLVIFERALEGSPGPVKGRGKGKAAPADKRQRSTLVTQLQEELSSVKDNLQSVIHDLENANQELQSANEEVLSSNEELQSANEELETSKEELQSSNEELSTVNDELQERNQELFRLNNDLVNVLNIVQLPILIVSNELTVRRYTAAAAKVFNLIPTDVGRPFAHISSTAIQMTELQKLIQDVLDNSQTREKDFRGKDGKWYHLRIQPYRTEERKIEGAVVTVQESADHQTLLQATRALLDMVSVPFMLLDQEFRVTSANRAFSEFFRIRSKQVEGSELSEIATDWNHPRFKKILDKVIRGRVIEAQETINLPTKKTGKRMTKIVVRRLAGEGIGSTQYLVSFEEKSGVPRK